MHEDIPAYADPFWRPSTTIRIPRVIRDKQPDGNVGRAKRPKLVTPGIFRANDNASRHHSRLHVAETGVRQSGTRKDSTTFLASSGTKVGDELNPTGILVCGLQGGEHVPGDFEQLMAEREWCPECRAALRSWMDARKIQSELGSGT